MRILNDLDGHHVLSRNDGIRHVELTAHKGAFDASDLLTVHIYICFPVDTVEVQEQAVLLESFGHFKLIPVPEVGPEE